MRRGELLSVSSGDIDFARRTLLIQETKMGILAAVPLTRLASSTAKAIARRDEGVFPVTANAVRLAWEPLREREDLLACVFHDLRHVAMISGHREPQCSAAIHTCSPSWWPASCSAGVKTSRQPKPTRAQVRAMNADNST